MRNTILGALAGAAAIGALSIGATLSNSNAQAADNTPVTQGAPPGPGAQRGQGQPGQPGQFGPQGPGGGMMMGGGGGTAMVVDADSLYIVQGNRLFKVRKSNLEVIAQGTLPMMRPPEGIGNTAPARAGGGGGTK